MGRRNSAVPSQMRLLSTATPTVTTTSSITTSSVATSPVSAAAMPTATSPTPTVFAFSLAASSS